MADIHSILYRGPNPLHAAAKPKFDPNSRKVRLWPGKAPEYAKDGDADQDDDDDINDVDQNAGGVLAEAGRRRAGHGAGRSSQGFSEVANATVTGNTNDLSERRMKLIEEAGGGVKSEGARAESVGEKLRRRRVVRESQVVSDARHDPDMDGLANDAKPRVGELNESVAVDSKEGHVGESSKKATRRKRVVKQSTELAATASASGECDDGSSPPSQSQSADKVEYGDDVDVEMTDVKDDDNSDDEHDDDHRMASSSTTSKEEAAGTEAVEDRKLSIDSRRAQLREIALAKRQAAMTARSDDTSRQAASGGFDGGGGDNDDESDEDYSTSSEEDEEDVAVGHFALRKPVFVPRNKRETLKEREFQQEEQLRKEAERERQLAERKRTTEQLVVQKLREEAEELEAAAAGPVDEQIGRLLELNDADDVDEAEELELWKIRELRRIKRDKEERDARIKFLAEIERRRNMTDEERQEDDRRLDAAAPKLEKGSKYRFMQKYYHQGAFFQDKKYTGEEDLYARDTNQPIGEDAFDKKLLPAAMQKRRGEFGRAGQTKYTHLADQDTTDFNAAWVTSEAATKGFKKHATGGKHATALSRPSKKPGGGK